MYVSEWIETRQGRLFELGESSLLIELKNSKWDEIHQLAQLLENKRPKSIINIIPAYDSIGIIFDNDSIGHNQLIEQINQLDLNSADLHLEQRQLIEIPVCYALVQHQSDIESQLQLSMDEIVSIHTNPIYQVAMIGFLPGFLYLSGMDKRLILPRKEQISRKVPEGAVAIGGEQTGIYSLPSPGGWHVIGQSPLKLFNAHRQPPFSFQVGDQIRFKAIDQHEFDRLQEKS